MVPSTQKADTNNGPIMRRLCTIVRKIIKIDNEKCIGCGLCANACHEDAIAMMKGKAVLLHDDFCDGLGDCLPVCPTNAIRFEKREAAAYNEAGTKRNMHVKTTSTPACGCPGTHAQTLGHGHESDSFPLQAAPAPSQLGQWPVQIKLAPIHAPYFDGASLLIAADCTAYAHANFHTQFMQGKITLIGCPKLDTMDYSAKLAEILKGNDIISMTVVRMEVPCCSGIERAAKAALENSGKKIPWQVITLSVHGQKVNHASSHGGYLLQRD